MISILTNCTNRKRGSVTPGLVMGSLTTDSIDNVAKQWIHCLDQAPSVNLAKEVYCGRSFREAVASASLLNCPLFIVSAGLGIVSSDRLIPVYNLTSTPGTQNSITNKITGNFSAKDWWSRVSRGNPFGSSLLEVLEKHLDGLILIALSRPYLELLQDELIDFPVIHRHRLRFFGKLGSVIPDSLVENWMPYDDRLDSAGPGYSGTQTDFAQRALRHFVTELLNTHENGNACSHSSLVKKSLSSLSRREIPKRQRLSDIEISTLIFDNWGHGEGKSSKLLRIVRHELGIACEQSRFNVIYRTIKKKMEVTV